MKREDIDAWFSIQNDGSPDSDYYHLRLQQSTSNKWKCIEKQLKSYVESAHADARRTFFESLGLSLDPLDAYDVDYPRHLPLDTQKGCFGEIFCGVISETLELVGRKKWVVPAFLFRFHSTATEYLTALILGADTPKAIPGRTGSDFIALALDPQGNVQEFLVGEAKCHQTLNITMAHEALSKLGKEPATPIGLPQLRQILSSTDKEKMHRQYSPWRGYFSRAT